MLLISGSQFFVTFNNTLVFPDPEPPRIKNPYEWSGWIIDSVIDHTITVSKYNPLAGGSDIKLPK